jgi:Fe-S-cluster containining protein
VLFARDQRFTCAQCGRCCRRATVPVTLGEAEAYRRAKAGRWFRESNEAEEGTEQDPFEAIPSYPGLLRIRKRADGACGFLSPSGLCRIHEELGADRKPLACRVFPFRFHPVENDLVVTTFFSCPTVVANEGEPLSAQTRDISTLHIAWKREQPEAPARVEFVAGRALPAATLPKLRSLLIRILDTPAADGSFDLRVSLRRIAAFVDDLMRPRVLRLPESDFADYFDVMSRHALTPDNVPAPRPAPWLARFLFRGFLLSAMSVQLHLDPVLGKRPAAIRLALFRLLAHLHGLGSGTAGFDLAAARTSALDIGDDDIREIATHFLRSQFETIGSGRRPIVDEIAMAVAHLNAACVFARMDAAAHGRGAVDAASFTQGVLTSADLMQADDGGALSRLLTTLSGGIDALYLFPPLTT